MVKGMKRIILFLFCVIVLLFSIVFPQQVSAQVVINEVSPNGTGSSEADEFIEIYNFGLSSMAISNWTLTDTLGTTKTYVIPDLSINPGQFISFKRSTTNITLNNDSDGVVLKDNNNLVKDEVSFKNFAEGKTISRIPDGVGNFVNDTDSSEGSANIIPLTLPSPSSSTSPSQTTTKAVYKINKSKDGFGSELTNVQIYVDGQYVHHLDDEILEFGLGNECYSNVACDYGNHEISLRKDGYISWEDSRDFQDGVNLVVNPVLYILASNSTTSSTNPTSTSNPTPTKTPTQKPKATTTPTASSSGALVEETSEGKTLVPNPSGQVSGASTEKKDKFPIAAVGLVVIGLVFITFAVFSIIKSVKKSYTGGDEGKDS